MGIKKFQEIIWENYLLYGRHDLPWRKTTDPYKILVSEIMLQQTQVERVLKKYPEFIEKFADFQSLANASAEQILRVWQGMGYNRRALYLKKIAERVVKDFKGELPQDPEILETFPGIGKNTAGAIVTFAFNKPIIFLETNIRRVFIHFFEALQEPMSAEANFRLRGRRPRDELERRRIDDNELLPIIEQTLDRKNPREWYYAIVDYGAMLGKSAGWRKNPNRKSKHYTKQSQFEGSNRQVRGMILKLLFEKKVASENQLVNSLGVSDLKITKNLLQLNREGFITKVNRKYSIKSK